MLVSELRQRSAESACGQANLAADDDRLGGRVLDAGLRLYELEQFLLLLKSCVIFIIQEHPERQVFGSRDVARFVEILHFCIDQGNRRLVGRIGVSNGLDAIEIVNYVRVAFEVIVSLSSLLSARNFVVWIIIIANFILTPFPFLKCTIEYVHLFCPESFEGPCKASS